MEQSRRYKLDTTFLHLPVSEALEQLQATLKSTSEKVEKLEEEKRECLDEMEGLKKVLYEKFGSEFSRFRGFFFYSFVSWTCFRCGEYTY